MLFSSVEDLLPMLNLWDLWGTMCFGQISSNLMHRGRSLVGLLCQVHTCFVHSEHHRIRSSIDEWQCFNTSARLASERDLLLLV